MRVLHPLPALDRPDYPLLPRHFDEARGVIEAARGEGGRALIYCLQGVNRSAALSVAYLVDRGECDLLGAVARVARARGRVLTNR